MLQQQHTSRIAVGVRQLFRSYRGWAVLLLVAGGSACAPEIGDDCGTALDCSASGTRLCDQTQTRGYCTIEGCEADTCPGEAVCVQFGRRIDGNSVDRLSRTYCMYKCDSNSDCRTEDRYECYSGGSFGSRGEAQVLGAANQKFCAPSVPEASASDPDDGPMSLPDGSTHEVDAATGEPDASTTDAATGDASTSDSAAPDDDAGASE